MPAVSPTNITSAPGIRHNTSNGPIASSTVRSSKIRKAIRMAFSFLSGAQFLIKAAAVCAGRHVQRADEGAAHRLARAKAAGGRDRVDAFGGFLQAAARGLDARILDEFSRRHADFAREHAGEVARAHRRAPRERFDRQVAAEMIRDRSLQVAQWLAIGLLRAELYGKLRLPSRSAQEHDQLTRDRQRNFAAVV